MKALLLHPFLAVHPAEGDRGWFVICSPGPLADLLAELAGVPAETCTIYVGGNGTTGRDARAVPLTDALDRALYNLADALITLRYETGQVQLRLALRDGEKIP